MTLIQVEDYNHVDKNKLLDALIKTRQHQYSNIPPPPISSFIAELEHRLGWHTFNSNCPLCKEEGRM
jgi:hypothetical protein